MQIWIRSQDGSRLVQPTNITIKEHFIVYEKVGGIERTYVLGEYESAERAKEVLDTIEQDINRQGRAIMSFNAEKRTYNFPKIVYQMPEK